MTNKIQWLDTLATAELFTWVGKTSALSSYIYTPTANSFRGSLCTSPAKISDLR